MQHHNEFRTFPYAQPQMNQVSQPDLLTSLVQTHRRGDVIRGSGDFTYNPAGDVQGDTAIFDYINNIQDRGYLPAMPMTGGQPYDSPPTTPFGNHTGYLQGMAIGGEEFTNLLTTEGLHDLGNGFADATDDVFTT